jgi:hypothetical protein
MSGQVQVEIALITLIYDKLQNKAFFDENYPVTN